MKCESCTLCCTLLPIKSFAKPANITCKFCNLGCTIHSTTIPSECSQFECAYYQAENVPIDLRPDKCGVIFEKISNDLFFGTLDPNNKPTEYAKKQVSVFIKQGFSVILYSIKEIKPALFLAKGHTQEMIDNQVSKYLNGRT